MVEAVWCSAAGTLYVASFKVTAHEQAIRKPNLQRHQDITNDY